MPSSSSILGTVTFLSLNFQHLPLLLHRKLTRQQLLELDHKLIASTFPDFTFSSSVRDLGVTLDSELAFALLTRSCFYQLRRLRAIRRSVSPKGMPGYPPKNMV